MRIFLDFRLRTTEWGDVWISRVLPRGDDMWGGAAPLRETPWGDGLTVVTGENLSHALHGHAMPLLRSLGSPPRVRLQRIPEGWRICAMSQGCLSYRAERCQPCRELPDCFMPPQLPAEAQELATHVARAWRDGYYVVLVAGEEFAL